MKTRFFFRRIFNSLSFSVLLIDRNYTVVEFNDAASPHLRRPGEKLVGQSCHEVTHGLREPCWHSGKVDCPVKDAFDTGVRSRAIHRHRVGGRTVVEEIIATPIDEGDREINYVVEEFRDVTELLELREGILPACGLCKRIRDEKGEWHKFESYIRDRTGADFTHSLCPACLLHLYPELADEVEGSF